MSKLDRIEGKIDTLLDRKSENQELRELLRECREKIYTAYGDIFDDLLDRIDNQLEGDSGE